MPALITSYSLYIAEINITQMNSFLTSMINMFNLKLCQDAPEINYFMYSKAYNSLVWVGENHEQLYLDFSSDKMLWRYHKINKAQEPILRAVGWKSNQILRVLDVTAGLGRDSAMMAASGINVTMVERNPILQILLEAALLQLKDAHDSGIYKNSALHYQSVLSEHLRLIKGNSIEYLAQYTSSKDNNINRKYDILYMDPMFPHRKKSALVKLDLRMVRELVGDDSDAVQLLDIAIKTGIKRVVIKRPKGAPYLGDMKPHHKIESPNMRFDVYQTFSLGEDKCST